MVHLCGGTLLTLSQENTGLWPLTAHCIDGSRTVGHDKPTVDGWKTWTEEWTHGTLSNTLVRHWASHRVGVTRAVGHTFSAVPGSVMWAVEWTRVSLRNAAVRLLASNNGVDVTRAGPWPLHAVHRWERWARRCWHSQGSGEKGEEEHASRRDILRLTLRNDPVFSAPQHATCDLFAAFVVTELSNSFYLALDNIYSNQFCSLLVLADIAFSVKPKSLFLYVKHPKNCKNCPISLFIQGST